MEASRGYFELGTSQHQDDLLDQMIALAKPGTVGVFDLDGCLFDTRQRQLSIFREFAAQHDAFELLEIQASDFKDWSLGRTIENLKLSDARRAEILEPLKDFWFQRFFLSRYTAMDPAMPGSVSLIKACADRGMTIVYLTGRHHEMRPGTIEALQAYGFPYDPPRAQLITKPTFEMDDTEYKADALEQIKQLGTPVLFVDNEPANVNAFRAACPDSTSVFIETDHSPRPDRPDREIPWLRSFYRSHQPGAVSALPLPLTR